jgi:hypothetical protein
MGDISSSKQPIDMRVTGICGYVQAHGNTNKCIAMRRREKRKASGGKIKEEG